MSSLIESLATPRRATPGPSRSRMDVWVDTLDKAEAEAVIAAAISPDWGHTALLPVLLEAGAPDISKTAFSQWRERMRKEHESR